MHLTGKSIIPRCSLMPLFILQRMLVFLWADLLSVQVPLLTVVTRGILPALEIGSEEQGTKIRFSYSFMRSRLELMCFEFGEFLVFSCI